MDCWEGAGIPQKTHPSGEDVKVNPFILPLRLTILEASQAERIFRQLEQNFTGEN